MPVQLNNRILKALPLNMRVLGFRKQSFLCCKDLAVLILEYLGSASIRIFFYYVRDLKDSLIKGAV